MAAYRADDEYDYLFKLVLIGDSGVGHQGSDLGYCWPGKVKAVDEEMGIGFQPKWGLKDIPIMPKECYLGVKQ
ncbi:hypothetical protein K1719_003627 [Acacia pycnantha]|nr:hypothetical protein K1719_003627 [Acacia pycnantha]